MLEGIYESVEQRMKWDCMTQSEDTDENGEHTYTAPEPDTNDEYSCYMSDYQKYTVYQKVLKAIEKLAQ